MEKRPYGGWINYKSLEQNALNRRGIEFPRRERILVRTALKRMGLLYMEIIPFYNPLRNSIQWLDFCILGPNKRMFVLLFSARYSGHGVKPHELEAEKFKVDYMKERGTPCLVLKRTYTSFEYEVLIRRFINVNSDERL